MVLAPRLAFSPTSVSPMYEGWGTLAPGPMSEFFTSTKVPTLAPSRMTLPGRRYAKGPTSALCPTSASTRYECTTRAPSAIRVSRMVVEDAPLGQLLGRHEAGSVVDPERDGRVWRQLGHDPAAAFADQREGPREVALAVLELDVVEGRKQRARLEDIGAEVHLADGELGRRDALGVLGLDDALDGAVLAPDDPPVPGRVELIGCEDRRGRSLRLVFGEQLGDVRRRDERMVPGEDHHRPVDDGRPRGEHGRAGPLALVLLGNLDPLRESLRHPVARPDNAHDPGRARPARGIDHPLDHGLTADGMKHLRSARPHPRPLAGGHDEGREGLGHGSRSVAPRMP